MGIEQPFASLVALIVAKTGGIVSPFDVVSCAKLNLLTTESVRTREIPLTNRMVGTGIVIFTYINNDNVIFTYINHEKYQTKRP